jgi:hypothetical protein
MTTIPIQPTSIISSYSTNLKKRTSNIVSSERNSQQSGTLSLSDIAKKYDVENISPQEMEQLSKELYNNHHISLLTVAKMCSLPDLEVSFEGILAQKTGAETQTCNCLQEWKDRLEIKGLSQDEVVNTKEIISLLQNLKALK